jgi:transcription termination factor Rho
MSVESQQLERSALERKDRDELHTIALALGGKPGSRAKKADIVDLILELAGVPGNGDGGNGAAGGAGRTRRAKKDDEAATSVDADEAEVAAEPELKAEPAEAAEASSEAVGETAEAATDADTQPEPGTKPDRGSRNRNGGGGERKQGDRGNQQQGDRGNQQQGDRGNQQQGDRGNQQQGGIQQGGQGGDPEPGNRRRRRRGRDRDRERPQQEEQWQGEPVDVEGLLDLRDEGYGFLRVKGYLPSKEDTYVSVKQVRQFGLRKGDHVKGASRPAGRNEKNPALLRVDLVNGLDPEQARNRGRFEDLTPLFPDEKLSLEVESDTTNMTARIVDLVSPIGKGQRGLIVSPPKAGKTTVMKQIARSIETNNEEVHLMVLLIDERPEEVTDMRRWVKGEVVASTFDRPSDEHTMVAELAIERAKRLVEEGKDVVIILDGITRLARAYNLAAPATGRIMSGGIDTGALYPPKKFFGAARNIEEGGSLTILATALIDTGSKMDEVIFEEFKGTGNMELRLDRKLAERRIYPAIDVDASSTRHEELLFERKQLQMVWKLRRVLSGLGEGGGGAGLEMLIDRLSTFKSNDEFLAEVAKAPSAGA